MRRRQVFIHTLCKVGSQRGLCPASPVSVKGVLPARVNKHKMDEVFCGRGSEWQWELRGARGGRGGPRTLLASQPPPTSGPAPPPPPASPPPPPPPRSLQRRPHYPAAPRAAHTTLVHTRAARSLQIDVHVVHFIVYRSLQSRRQVSESRAYCLP